MTAQHPGTPGTRACWAAGCPQYECVIAADVDPVKVERHLQRRDGSPSASFTNDEREEWLRRRAAQASSRVAQGAPRGRLHYPYKH